MAVKQYFGVGGVARNIKGWNFEVDGVARTVISGYEGVGGVAKQFLTSLTSNLPERGNALEEYSWAEISAVARAGLAKTYWSVGDTKSWISSSNGFTYQAQIVDFDRDLVYDKITTRPPFSEPYGRDYAGITFELCSGLGDKTKNGTLTAQTYAFYNGTDMTAYNGYFTSTIKTTVEALSNHPDIVNAGIAEVVVPVWKNVSATDGESHMVTCMGFFLPGLSEILGIANVDYDEGEQYTLYKNYNFANVAQRIRYFSKTAVPWWTRTVSPDDGNKSYAITRAGTFAPGAVTNTAALAPMFCV